MSDQQLTLCNDGKDLRSHISRLDLDTVEQNVLAVVAESGKPGEGDMADAIVCSGLSMDEIGQRAGRSARTLRRRGSLGRLQQTGLVDVLDDEDGNKRPTIVFYAHKLIGEPAEQLASSDAAMLQETSASSEPAMVDATPARRPGIMQTALGVLRAVVSVSGTNGRTDVRPAISCVRPDVLDGRPATLPDARPAGRTRDDRDPLFSSVSENGRPDVSSGRPAIALLKENPLPLSGGGGVLNQESKRPPPADDGGDDREWWGISAVTVDLLASRIAVAALWMFAQRRYKKANTPKNRRQFVAAIFFARQGKGHTGKALSYHLRRLGTASEDPTGAKITKGVAALESGVESVKSFGGDDAVFEFIESHGLDELGEAVRQQSEQVEQAKAESLPDTFRRRLGAYSDQTIKLRARTALGREERYAEFVEAFSGGGLDAVDDDVVVEICRKGGARVSAAERANS